MRAAEAAERTPMTGSLWRHRSFRLLWVGQSVSEIGSALSTLAVPLLAVTALSATAFDVAMLTALSGAAIFLAAVPAGYLADRAPHRLVLIGCDLGRLVLVASIPLAAAFGFLHLVQVYVATTGISALTLIFGVVYHSYYPTLVDRSQLVDANAKIASTESFARIAGPGLGGLLVGLLGAARTLTIDAGSYLVGLVALALIRTPAAASRSDNRRSNRRVLRTGIKLIRSDPVLARLVGCTLGGMVSLAMTGSVLVIYLVRDLHQSSETVGLAFAIGEAGGLAAAVLAARLIRRTGPARTLTYSSILAPAGYLLLLATAQTALAVACVALACSAARFVLLDIVQYTYRQQTCPQGQLGRLNATIRLGTGAATLAGGLAAGVASPILGNRAAIAISTTVLCLSTGWLLREPLRTARMFPAPPARPIPATHR
jgi:MFS family permease